MTFLKKYKWTIIITVSIFALVAVIEHFMGRSFFGPDGKFGWWDGSIWSSENSQRVADPYSLTHIVHGFMFYGLLWLVARRLPLKYRYIAAVLLAASWEILENSPYVIGRYREATISLGYVGDSMLNSLSDIVMMSFGFLLASKFKVWGSVLTVIAIEFFLLVWVRDNLTLNIIMLIYPIQAIKVWQSVGH